MNGGGSPKGSNFAMERTEGSFVVKSGLAQMCKGTYASNKTRKVAINQMLVDENIDLRWGFVNGLLSKLLYSLPANYLNSSWILTIE